MNEKTAASWLRLPAEVLAEVALKLGARDVVSLGATCRLLHDIARDDYLWRRLFARDYAWRYASCALATPCSHDVAASESMFEYVCAKFGVGALAPSGSADNPWPPRPFAHMEAVGKNACWLYAAHARVCSYTPSAIMQTPGPISVLFKPEDVIDQISYVGDTLTNRHTGLVGYGTCIEFDDKSEAVAWRENVWERSHASGWRAAASSLSAIAARSIRSGRLCLHCLTDCDTGVRTWTVNEPDHSGGVTVTLYMNGTRKIRYLSRSRENRVRILSPCGSVSDFKSDRLGRAFGKGTTQYANGDVVVSFWDGGDLQDILEFQCSPRCADPEFAGCVITGERWAWCRVVISHDLDEYVFWPKGDSDACRLFERYVARGLIGWKEHVRAAAAEIMDIATV